MSTPHPFARSEFLNASAIAGAPAPAVGVGADGAAPAIPSGEKETPTSTKLLAAVLTLGFFYYLGMKQGKTDGYMRGHDAGERSAREGAGGGYGGGGSSGHTTFIPIPYPMGFAPPSAGSQASGLPHGEIK